MEKRVRVWMQKLKDRRPFALQWHDPETGRRKSRTAGTEDPKEAEKARADLEYELNHGKYQQASRMTWEHFRELFEAEHAANQRPNTQKSYRITLDAFEEVCNPGRLASITERTLSLFVAGLRDRETATKKGNQASTIKVRLQLMRTALRWAVDQKMIAACPKFPAVKVPKKRPQPIPAESFERLYAKAPDAQTRTFLLAGWLACAARKRWRWSGSPQTRLPTLTCPMIVLSCRRSSPRP